MNDELFGEIEYELAWVGRCSWPIFGSVATTLLSIPCDEFAEIEPVQREAFAAFKQREDMLCARAEEAIFANYLEIIPEYQARFGPELAARLAPNICRSSGMSRLVTPTEVIIQQSFTHPPERVIGLLFDCSWEPSLGLAVKLVNDEVSEVGTQDVVL